MKHKKLILALLAALVAGLSTAYPEHAGILGEASRWIVDAVGGVL